MASTIDFLKKGLPAESKAFIDELVMFTRTEAENTALSLIQAKTIDHYINKAKAEDWIAGPVETLCDDTWDSTILKAIIKKIKGAAPETEKVVKQIADLDNVLYHIFNDVFTSTMNKKGYDDAKYHLDIFNDETVADDDDDDEEITEDGIADGGEEPVK